MDFNGYVEKVNKGDETVIGMFGYGGNNDVRQAIIDSAHDIDMVIMNTYYKKRESDIVMYTSGGKGP